MGRCAGRLRGRLRGLCRLARRGRTAGRDPAGRPAYPRLPAAAARYCDRIAGAAGSALMSEPPAQPVKLLLSAFALRTWGARIEAAGPAGSLSFVTAEEALAADGPCGADIAFMTREVTGKSSSN